MSVRYSQCDARGEQGRDETDPDMAVPLGRVPIGPDDCWCCCCPYPDP